MLRVMDVSITELKRAVEAQHGCKAAVFQSVPIKETKETKGAVRFQEVGEDGKPAFAPSIGTLYIRKSALPDGKIPQTLTVTITI